MPVKSLLHLFSTFIVTHIWVSDQGPHFKNSLITEINRFLHTHHHFTTPHYPQSSLTVELVCKQQIPTFNYSTDIGVEIKGKRMPFTLQNFRIVLNHAPRPTLGSRAPRTIFTELPCDNPLLTLLPPPPATASSLTKLKIQKLVNIEAIHSTLDKNHR